MSIWRKDPTRTSQGLFRTAHANVLAAPAMHGNTWACWQATQILLLPLVWIFYLSFVILKYPGYVLTNIWKRRRRKKYDPSREMMKAIHKGYQRYIIEHESRFKVPPAELTSDQTSSVDLDPKSSGNRPVWERHHEYRFLWWNAWLYSGSDNLWAGLITELWGVVEDRYGSAFVHAEYEAMVVAVWMKLILASVLAAFAAVVIMTDVPMGLNFQGDLYQMVLFFTTGLASVALIFHSAHQGFTTPFSRAQKIVDDVASGKIRDKLGFMNDIKTELAKIGKMLETPDHNVDCFLHYLLPDWWLKPGDPIPGWWGWMFVPLGLPKNRHAKCRIVISVDDLDRCPPHKAVEVLQSLVLLTEGTPFILFLAIDPRVVTAAIECHSDKFFGENGINGTYCGSNCLVAPPTTAVCSASVRSWLLETLMVHVCGVSPALRRRVSRQDCADPLCDPYTGGRRKDITLHRVSHH